MAEDCSRNVGGNSIMGVTKKLSGLQDYQDWKFQECNYLEHQDLWECIEPDHEEDGRPKPVDAKERKAKVVICLLVETGCYAHVRNAATAREAWENLRKAYEDKGWGRRISLQRSLWQCRLENFRSKEEYIAKVMTLSQQLADIDAKVMDDWLASILLSGLTPDYGPMIMALDNSGQEITTELVKGKLLQEWGRKRSDVRESDDSALFAKNNSNPKLQVKSRKKQFPFMCYQCNQPGHKASDCNKRTNNAKRCEEGCLLTALSVGLSKGDWYVNSGASTHMTSRKEWLSDFSEEGNGMEVTMVNNDTVRSGGRGDVKVKLIVDSKISDVVFVPGLATNLLSVSKMAKNGLSVVFSNEKCRIFRNENLSVQGDEVATATDTGGIYRLDVKCIDGEHSIEKGLSEKKICVQQTANLVIGASSRFLATLAQLTYSPPK
ncbi:hypothetical protein J437_LFUL002830 [Ladona fulva]|uniref:CCHC-type domain-containing protein n=1 Tax=Ladona fulva TaxID=123851 RepID=A0A8K0K393_LADFU|nr:hypothetical protein J437_LFUL002830 [Ladona fulva]